MRPGRRMRRVMFWVGVAIIPSATGAMWAGGLPPAAPAPFVTSESPPTSPTQEKEKSSDLIVHEWGTFLGMNGSDGAALDGMYHEEHALPTFVHSRGRDQLRLPFMKLKGETPVIYFYTKVRQPVRVGVGFPRGIWTQWYPQASLVSPSLMEQAEKPDRLSGGRICWFAEVIPAAAVKHEISNRRGAVPESEVKLPATSSDALWNHAREVDAAFVKTLNAANDAPTPEFEKFLFYRGLGETRLPLRFDEGGKGALALDRDESLGDGVRHVFVLRVENGRGAYIYRPALRPGERVEGVIPSMAKAQPLVDFSKTVADLLAARLAETGLYDKEARAMVNTWTTSYFQTDGIRVLFVLPQSWTDAFIPMTIVPQPRQVVRVMVGRLELLTGEREGLAENAVRGLADPDATRRQQAFGFLHEQGRYVEPILRRVLKTTKEDGVRTLCRRLLMSDLVTELRAALHNAADGKRLNTDPVLLRAQLARLLREIGLGTEARAEGDAVLAALKVHSADQNPPQAASLLALEIRAAALEAIGDDQTAARIYARRVELQARSMIGDINPALIAWLRDWWVGRTYAQCLARSGKTGATIVALKERLSRPTGSPPDLLDDRATRMLLAFLLDGQGKPALAESQWSSLAGKPKLNAASMSPDSGAKASGESGL
jgi:hypothetical protein